MEQDLPVVVIGAGAVGLAAAAHLLARGLRSPVLERTVDVGASLRDWAHVRVFTLWRDNVDVAALVRNYLGPLVRVPALAPYLRCQADVTAVSRLGFDKLPSAGRELAPSSCAGAGVMEAETVITGFWLAAYLSRRAERATS